MCTETYKSTDNLVDGIREILLKNRCSFSVEELALLESCIERLEKSKNENLEKPKRQFEIIEVLNILIKIFDAGKSLIDFFNN